MLDAVAENQKLRLKVENLRRRNQDLEDLLGTWEKKAAESEAWAKQCQAAEAVRAERFAELTDEVARLRAAGTAQDLLDAKGVADAKAADLEGQLEELRERVEELEEELEEAQGAERGLEEAQEEIEELEERLKDATEFFGIDLEGITPANFALGDRLDVQDALVKLLRDLGFKKEAIDLEGRS